MTHTLPEFQRVDSFVGNHEHAGNLTDRACPVCGGSAHRPVLEMGNFQFFTDSAEVPKRVTLKQVQCRHCLTLFQNPCFSEQGFGHLFAEAGLSYGSAALRPTEQRNWLEARGLLRPGTVVLDVGCYEGSFLSHLPANLVRQGVDIDARAIARGQAREPSLELVHSAFDRFTLSRQPQVITMIHVLEHLPDPVAVLRRLHEVASHDACLVIEVPIIELGPTNDINGFFSVQHITHFSRHSLTNALGVAGWQVMERVTIDGYNGYRVMAVKASPLAAQSGHVADIAAVHEVMANWYQAQGQVEAHIAELKGQENVVIWGAGLHTEFLYQCTSLFQSPQRRFLLVDSDPMKQQHSWRGIPIAAPSALRGHDWRHSMLVISSYGGQTAIAEAASALGVPENRQIRLYDRLSVY